MEEIRLGKDGLPPHIEEKMEMVSATTTTDGSHAIEEHDNAEGLIRKYIRQGFRRLIPVTPRVAKPCNYCKLPMMVSVGQIAYWHGSCRTLGRKTRAHAQ